MAAAMICARRSAFFLPRLDMTMVIYDYSHNTRQENLSTKQMTLAAMGELKKGILIVSTRREPLEGAGCQQALPTLDEVLSDPSASSWLKHALRSALDRDPVDAEGLARLLDIKRSRLVLSQLWQAFGPQQ
jgi:hypothetical protein